MGAAELHGRVETAFNAGDVDALVGLYEAGARLMREDGTTAEGASEIREVWAGFIAMGGTIRIVTRYAVEAGDTALLSNSWTFELDGTSASSSTAEVARRAGDGAWRYIIDNPFAGPGESP
jgi:ketosteroid isomerase-like protein